VDLYQLGILSRDNLGPLANRCLCLYRESHGDKWLSRESSRCQNRKELTDFNRKTEMLSRTRDPKVEFQHGLHGNGLWRDFQFLDEFHLMAQKTTESRGRKE